METFERRRSLFPYVAGAVLVVLFLLRSLSASGGGAAASSVPLDGPSAPRTADRRRSGARVWVHVAGAVKRPGLYRIDADARGGAAVDAAGGLTRRADLRSINLAATVRDGQQIIVPARGEVAAAPPAQGAVGGGTGPAGSPQAGSPQAGTPQAGTTGGAGGSRLSLGSATAEQLDTLDGIGPTLAQRIVQWRDAHGGFQSVEQLREIEGIGDKRFQSLRAAVTP
jgi:competence protein ComEA